MEINTQMIIKVNLKLYIIPLMLFLEHLKQIYIYIYMLNIDIFKNYSQHSFGVLRGNFLGFGCPKSSQ